MAKSLRRALFVAVSLFLPGVVFSTELPGKWVLSIENVDHVVLATLKVEFTEKPSRSCMSGEWKVVKVVSAKTTDKQFFPASDPLSYRIENNQLTIGRNQVCDDYLWLQGSLEGPSASGDYFSLGLGESAPLGHFKLLQAK
jgi:hypothetical protein